jgi:hypothetical protein
LHEKTAVTRRSACRCEEAIETLAVLIALSQIVVAQPHSPVSNLPGGFDDVDIDVLDWIAAEVRSVSCNFVRM